MTLNCDTVIARRVVAIAVVDVVVSVVVVAGGDGLPLAFGKVIALALALALYVAQHVAQYQYMANGR